jgi:hypothetical protein
LLVDERLLAVDLVDDFLAMIFSSVKVIRLSMLTLSDPRFVGRQRAPAARGSIAHLRRAIVNNRPDARFVQFIEGSTARITSITGRSRESPGFSCATAPGRR